MVAFVVADNQSYTSKGNPHYVIIYVYIYIYIYIVVCTFNNTGNHILNKLDYDLLYYNLMQ